MFYKFFQLFKDFRNYGWHLDFRKAMELSRIVPCSSRRPPPPSQPPRPLFWTACLFGAPEVQWALEKGIVEHADLYPALTKNISSEDIPTVLHAQSCPDKAQWMLEKGIVEYTPRTS